MSSATSDEVIRTILISIFLMILLGYVIPELLLRLGVVYEVKRSTA